MTLDEHFKRMRTDGSRAAERAFWRAVYVELWRFYRGGSDRAANEELVSRTVAVIMRKIATFEPRGSDSFTVQHGCAAIEHCSGSPIY